MVVPKRILITGGAGFIGSALIRFLIENTNSTICNFDALTYAGNLESLRALEGNPRYIFQKGDICDGILFGETMQSFQPDAVMHLAAESHVDRSIEGASDFVKTNVLGTSTVLECVRIYLTTLSQPNLFRFLHVSTDEVFGALGETDLFCEASPYAPNSPYSASKAASDHLVRAWHKTYGLPILVTNCSNNYGPYQLPEKLIPLMIVNALRGSTLPVYGNGQQIRDWIYVDDHVRGLFEVLCKGVIGETYCMGGNNEKTNLDVVDDICRILDDVSPKKAMSANGEGESYRSQISFVSDRPGHDYRYAINNSKIKTSLGWQPNETFNSGLYKTVTWYLDNLNWCNNVLPDKEDWTRKGLIK